MIRTVLLISVLLCVARTVAAQEKPFCPEPRGTAEEKKKAAGEWYGKGVQTVDEKDYLAAMAAFLCSYQHAPHPNTVYNLATAAEHLGEPSMAAAYYAQYLRLSPYDEDSDDVNRRITELIKKGGKPSADATDTTAEETLARARDDDRHGRLNAAEDRYLAYARMCPLEQQTANVLQRVHEIQGSREGAEPAASTPLASTAKREPAAPPPSERDAEPPPEQASGMTDAAIAGWSLVGGGGGALVAGAVLGVLYLVKSSNVENADPGTPFADVQDDYDTAPGLGIGSVVCLSAGGAAALVGAYLLIFETGNGQDGAAVSMVPSPAGFAISGVF